MFRVGRIDFDYCRERGYNDPFRNERTVELPLARYFLAQADPERLTEIGAVTPYYFSNRHSVVDPTDAHPGCLRTDARKADYRGRNVLSISTIEHIGNGEFQDALKDNSAYDLLQRIRREAERYLITFPLGYNANLDVSVRTGGVDCRVLKRVNEANEWEPCRDHPFDFCYNYPFNNGNAVCLVTNLEELLTDSGETGGRTRLNLGSGDDYREGWVNVDSGQCHKDIEHDLERLPLPFADSQFKEILLQHVIEHISRGTFPEFMREIHRIGKAGCRLHIAAPYFNSKNAWTDFTHKNFMTEESFGYFDDRHHLRHLGLIYGLNFSFRTLDISWDGPQDNLVIHYELEVVK
ncbi:MAG: hypothetical protein PHI18_09820 [bacterium]|nr:hypothetical protein [bacterium]